ncbi:MAG: alpha/beta hydrolase [Alphaproteobacteria bacterium]|nr:alpha/beta hydrolase [Alphaproteobacteria bacterium]
MEARELRMAMADGVDLAGRLYLPDGARPHPAVVMSHGFSGLMDMGLDPYARAFQAAGLACLVYDHRNFGNSGGAIRQEVDPWQQIRDMREVIAHARIQDEVDASRVGLWGTSYSGGHVLVIGAVDRRVACVVSQVPVTSGSGAIERMVTAPEMPGFLAQIYEDYDARARGEAPATVPVYQPGGETAQWAEKMGAGTAYRNEVTLRSRDLWLEYEPWSFMHRISPTPLLMIIAAHDTRVPTRDQLEAYHRALEPKELLLLDCAHYDPYMSRLEEAIAAGREFLVAHLQP